MQNQFEKFILNLLENKYDILPDEEVKFDVQAESNEQILRELNKSFLYLLAGSDNPNYKKAYKFLNELKSSNIYKQIAEFYLSGYGLVKAEINQKLRKDSTFRKKLEQLNAINTETHDYEQITETFWNVFFPEGLNLFHSEQRKKKVSELRELRKVKVTELNPNPIQDPIKEMVFTSNVLMTVPLDFERMEYRDLSKNLEQDLKKLRKENQKYWYDHPIPIDIEPSKNEVLYGLQGLSDMMQFEIKRVNAKSDDKLNCILSISVTHDGLHEIAKEYLQNELKNSKSTNNLNVFVFTENGTQDVLNEILIPIAKKYLKVDDTELKNLHKVIGVDGEYGRHYSFLKAITAIWQVFMDPKIKGTFKLDLDQVFPNEKLVEQSGSSVFEHFKSALWGAKGMDAHGNIVDLSMLAGALVNESDIEKSLYFPDVRYPSENEFSPDEHIFCSKIPQALSTEAEMMEKYNSKNLDGKNTVLTRVHVTGGTNGILIDALRKYRPFTPSFIGRAEDQAYLMSVLFDQSKFLRYLHKSGLIMRHDKHSFASEAIKAAETGKIIGDYIRILLFAHYAKMLPWSVSRIKSELNPFTGCFISETPFTVVFLRFVLLVNHLFSSEDDQNKNKATKSIIEGLPRIHQLINNMDNDKLKTVYLTESKAWHLFYDILDVAEKEIQNKNQWMLNIKSKALELFKQSKII